MKTEPGSSSVSRRWHTWIAAALFVAGVAAPPTASAHIVSSSHAPDTVEVWRLHPSKAAAAQASFTITINYLGSGNRGAMLVVEDEHQPDRRADLTTADMGYAELGSSWFFPEDYDNPEGVAPIDCSTPAGRCSELGGSPISDKLSWRFAKPIVNGRPAAYPFHDVYVGLVNAHATSIVISGPSWTQSRATNATMVLIQNQDTSRGVGVHVGNYGVEQFNGVQYPATKAAWSAVHVQLPCPPEVPHEIPTNEADAELTGFTLPEGQRNIQLSCHGTAPSNANALASGPTLWRLNIMPSSQPAGVDRTSATTNLNRFVALIVNPDAKPKKKGSR